MDQLSVAITKALAYTENGGKPALKNIKSGKSGELKSLFQFEPATWKAYSKQVTGQDNLPLTPANEAAVTYGKVNQWVRQFSSEGKNPQQIATAIGSLWNSGHADPSVAGAGVNKSGVKFDAPAYASKVANYTTQFLKNPVKSGSSGNSGMLATSQQPTSNPGMMPQQNSPQPQIGLPTAPGVLNA